MITTELSFKGVYLFEIEKKNDSRGFFTRLYCKNENNILNLNTNWVQMNLSFTERYGTVRGLHYQKQPFAEEKIVRCVKGSIWDVIVDLRIDSNTYNEWMAIELNDNNKKALYIPKGIAHGFQTLSNNVEVMYMHSQFYNAEYESGINYLDKTLNINWPTKITLISQRDLNLPYL
jgi:dTDP-4-dehydrorhamnose 3,5-epimerase